MKCLFVFVFTDSFVPAPCLCPTWSSGKLSGDCLTLTLGKLSYIQGPVSKDGLSGMTTNPSLGTPGAPGMNLQDRDFPLCVPHSSKAQSAQSRGSALFCEGLEMWAREPPYVRRWCMKVRVWSGAQMTVHIFKWGPGILGNSCRIALILCDGIRWLGSDRELHIQHGYCSWEVRNEEKDCQAAGS